MSDEADTCSGDVVAESDGKHGWARLTGTIGRNWKVDEAICGRGKGEGGRGVGAVGVVYVMRLWRGRKKQIFIFSEVPSCCALAGRGEGLGGW